MFKTMTYQFPKGVYLPPIIEAFPMLPPDVIFQSPDIDIDPGFNGGFGDEERW